jgi:hypothetical protein
MVGEAELLRWNLTFRALPGSLKVRRRNEEKEGSREGDE